MDKTNLLERITKIDDAIAQALATYQNLSGQKLEATFWLAELDKAVSVISEVVEHSKSATPTEAANAPKASK